INRVFQLFNVVIADFQLTLEYILHLFFLVGGKPVQEVTAVLVFSKRFEMAEDCFKLSILRLVNVIIEHRESVLTALQVIQSINKNFEIWNVLGWYAISQFSGKLESWVIQFSQCRFVMFSDAGNFLIILHFRHESDSFSLSELLYVVNMF